MVDGVPNGELTEPAEYQKLDGGDVVLNDDDGGGAGHEKDKTLDSSYRTSYTTYILNIGSR